MNECINVCAVIAISSEDKINEKSKAQMVGLRIHIKTEGKRRRKEIQNENNQIGTYSFVLTAISFGVFCNKVI